MNLRIAAFITASTLAHGAVALWLSANTLPQLALGGEARALRVVLLPAAQVVDYSALESRSVQAPRTSIDPLPTGVRQAATRHNTRRAQHAYSASHAKPVKTTPDNVENTKQQTTPVTGQLASNNNATAQPHSSAENIGKQISAALENRFARHFEYPWLARQRGWQGRVLLSLHVASNGDLSNWKVVRTSGYRTLDQSALKAARHIEHLPQAERWLHGKSLEVHLPVQYKLLDS